jgi:hypothetical protein
MITSTGTCPDCGAPLELDQGGNCRWCHAHLHDEPRHAAASHGPASHGPGLGLVPAGTDDCSTSAPFLYLTLAALGSGLSFEPVVREYARANPAQATRIRALSTAVSAAGVRVRDAGLLKDSFDQNLRVYTAEEIWTFELAIDVIAMLGALDGLPGQARAMVAEDVRTLNGTARGHHWNSELRKAGTGPEQFRQLRAEIPRR